MDNILIRLPSFNPREGMAFVSFLPSKVKYARAWMDSKDGANGRMGTVVFFDDGHEIKLDVTEEQFTGIMENAGYKIIGFDTK